MKINNKVLISIIIVQILLLFLFSAFEFFIIDILPGNPIIIHISICFFLVVSSIIMSFLLKYSIFIRVLIATICLASFFLFQSLNTKEITLRYYIENKTKKKNLNDLINICVHDSIISISKNTGCLEDNVQIRTKRIKNYSESRPLNYHRILDILDNIHFRLFMTNFKHFSFIYFLSSVQGTYGIVWTSNLNKEYSNIIGKSDVVKFDEINKNWYYFYVK
jgi:hypothetical protein